MTDITFITGNQDKADYLERYLGYPIMHKKVAQDEIQSLDLREVAEHKARQAYAQIGSPVLVEDVSLEFKALGRLPGKFIKFYVDEVPFDTICRTLDGLSREATARCILAYFDGHHIEFIEGHLDGAIAIHPAGDNGYGCDKIFVPKGYSVTRAQLDDAEYKKLYLQIKRFDKLKEFLEGTQ